MFNSEAASNDDLWFSVVLGMVEGERGSARLVVSFRSRTVDV